MRLARSADQASMQSSVPPVPSLRYCVQDVSRSCDERYPDNRLAGTRIDAHTHFTPLKFLDFAEKAEGQSFLFKSKPTLIGVQPRIDLLDHEEIDINVLVPVPWIDAFHPSRPQLFQISR